MEKETKEILPPITYDIKCACGKVCSVLEFASDTPVEKIEQEAALYSAECDDCKAKKNT